MRLRNSPRRGPAALALLALLVAGSVHLLACAGDAGDGPDLAAPPDLWVDKSAACADTFGRALTSGFGRLDGTVLAIVPPAHPSCFRSNNDHLVLEVLAGGAAYRMVVNVESDRPGADPRVRLAEITAPLPAPAFAEGWRNGLLLDYAKDLDQHAETFTPYAMDDLVARLTDLIPLGAPISVYASTSGGDSAHLIHRNVARTDGAIVLDPTGAAPRWLLFAFSTQSF